MKEIELSNLTDEELLLQRKKIKSGNTVNAFLIGLFIGIFVYSWVKNGLDLFTFLPLLFAFIAFSNRRQIKAVEKELESRNLK